MINKPYPIADLTEDGDDAEVVNSNQIIGGYLLIDDNANVIKVYPIDDYSILDVLQTKRQLAQAHVHTEIVPIDSTAVDDIHNIKTNVEPNHYYGSNTPLLVQTNQYDHLVNQSTPNALMKDLIDVFAYIYTQGYDDGESAYMAYNYQSEPSLEPAVRPRLIAIIKTMTKLTNPQKNQLLNELNQLAESYYEQGTEDGESTAIMDFDVDYVTPCENAITEILNKY